MKHVIQDDLLVTKLKLIKNLTLPRYVKKFLGAPTDTDQENLKLEYEKLLEE